MVAMAVLGVVVEKGGEEPLKDGALRWVLRMLRGDGGGGDGAGGAGASKRKMREE